MQMNFENILKKIIGVDELKNFGSVEKKLEKIEEGFIFQDNKPTHVIMTLEKYWCLNAQDNVEKDTTISENTVEGLDTLLNKVGKKIFVEYYHDFKNDNNPEERLQKEGFTLASRRSRSSSARSIFKNNMQVAALNNIIESDRVETEIVEKARKILAEELETGKEMKVAHEENTEYSVKIGKMMRGILVKLLQENELSIPEITQMQNAEYSKNVFNLNFPVIKVLAAGETIDEAKRDAKGYNRYYDVLVIAHGMKCMICSQWVENLHQTKAESWVVNKLAEIVHKKAKTLKAGEEFNVRGALIEYWPYVGYTTRLRVGSVFKNRIADDTTIVAVEGKYDHGQVYRVTAD